jgi:hypothetical protein
VVRETVAIFNEVAPQIVFVFDGIEAVKSTGKNQAAISRCRKWSPHNFPTFERVKTPLENGENHRFYWVFLRGHCGHNGSLAGRLRGVIALPKSVQGSQYVRRHGRQDLDSV